MQQRCDIISVVTVVYNGKNFIEKTLQSVLSQDYPYIEYIVIDGGSTDGTVDIIKKYSDQITYWISEPDKGIYDAMNKAIDRATGKWINFMNAGDYFYSDNAIKDIFSTDTDIDKYAIIYGDAEFRLKNIAYIVPAGDECNTNEYMPFSHQAAFIKSDIAKATKFDTSYRIVADTALSLKLLREGYQFKHIPVVVCSYDALEGLSVQNSIRRSKELVDMQVKLNGANPNSSYFKRYIRNAYIKQYFKKLLPTSLWTRFRESDIKKNNPYTYVNTK
ncbi:glycosyltransferase family 2 protein [Dysgonomonas sp. ZJ709]|uniref:glycosyltransferase family 2 protein n=1 Tax=Dysgonomonas sp. ZJ709 TaxID=2709797 RepID=UPI0013EC1C25|nr:glycosyltransferase family 2 protein [Dysgonomonas sp. ZJ709]